MTPEGIIYGGAAVAIVIGLAVAAFAVVVVVVVATLPVYAALWAWRRLGIG